ncbi:MAG: SMP-30/gluconolactonase/LRE family protein [Verrucomicrobiota bacterium]
MKLLTLLAASALVLAFDTNAADAPAKPDVDHGKPAPTTKAAKSSGAKVYPSLGKIERIEPSLDRLIPPDALIEKLASGFAWSEGPVWVRNGNYLLFSDIPHNAIFRWREGEGTSEFIYPSGYTGSTARGGEPGSNGLTLDAHGRLVFCQHGDRQVVRRERDGKLTVLAQYYQYRRFNSPNDLVYKSNGDLYFTDPTYGLVKQNADPARELAINGVYRVRKTGQVDLLVSDLSFPNGIAFSPDEKVLYVAVSDPKRAVWMAYDVLADGSIGGGRVFMDVTALVPTHKGLPDGLKVDQAGNLFATGPGGIFIISPQGKHLGTINTDEPTANCAWGGNGSILYITANDKLCRVKTTTRGKMP